MKGWLIVNGFIGSDKFREIYGDLARAAAKLDILLEIKASDMFTAPIGEKLLEDDIPDFVLFWDKDVHLARRLESEGVRLFNSARAVEICDSKMLTAEILTEKLSTPKTLLSPKTFEGIGYNSLKFVENAADILGLPMIIKEEYGSFGAQVYLARTLDEAKDITRSLGYKGFVMQEFIKESEGRDVRVNVIGDSVISAMERYNEKDFRSNISNGGSMRRIELPKKFAEAAVRACEIIGLDFAGVDILFGKNGPVVCEVNSNPHFKSSLECTGVDMSEEIMKYIAEQIK